MLIWLWRFELDFFSIKEYDVPSLDEWGMRVLNFLFSKRATFVGFCKEIVSLLIFSNCVDSSVLDTFLSKNEFPWLDRASIMNWDALPFFSSKSLMISLNYDEKYWKLEFFLFTEDEWFLDFERTNFWTPVYSLC